jgi:poly-beta-1,6-N-acetyl-D-glucosamine N-deacetylase
MADPRADLDYGPPAPRRGVVTKLSQLVIGAVFLVALALVTVSWIGYSRPFDPGQQTPAAVRLDQATTDAAGRMPHYPGSVVVVTYHAVSDHDHSGSTVTTRLFGEHIAALAAAGYRTVRLADVERLVARQPVQLPPKALLLTFDDGTLTDWTTVDPVLKAYHFNAVAFLTTGKMVAAGTPSYYLSSREVRALAATGRWEFGAHGHNLHELAPVPHDIQPAMSNLILVHGRPETLAEWSARVNADLASSQAFFRRVLGRPVSAFAYPYGETGRTGNAPQMVKLLPGTLQRAGFDVAFVGENVPTEHVDALSPQAQRWALDRIGVRATTSVTDLLSLIKGAVPVALPHNLVRLPWIGDLATCRRRAASLTVASDGYGTCLLGAINTSQWIDYTLRTHISGLSRRAAAVIAVRDGAGAGHRGRLEVVIGESVVIVREQIGDQDRRMLAKTRLPATVGGAREVQIVVRRDRAVIHIGGMSPLRVAFDRRLAEGGVKFTIASEGGSHAIVFRKPTLSATPRPK